MKNFTEKLPTVTVGLCVRECARVYVYACACVFPSELSSETSVICRLFTTLHLHFPQSSIYDRAISAKVDNVFLAIKGGLSGWMT